MRVLPVVEAVVDAALAEHGAVDILLGGVVVNDVEDDFYPRTVQGFDHVAQVVRAAVAAVGNVVRVDVVTPVVAHAAPLQVDFVKVLADGQELNGGNAKLFEVADAGFVRKSGEGTAYGWRDSGVTLAIAFDVQFVNDGVAPRGAQRNVAFPVVVAGSDDDAFRRYRRVIARVRMVIEREFVRRTVFGQVVQRAGVGIQQEFLRVVAIARFHRAVHTPAVTLPRFDTCHEDVPDVVAAVLHVNTGLHPIPAIEAEGHGAGMATDQREVHPAFAVNGGEMAAERIGLPAMAEQRRAFYFHASAPFSPS